VRGRGLMLGVELVEDQDEQGAGGAEDGGSSSSGARELGVLIGKGGLHGNVLRIKPPMCITKEDCDFMVEVLDIAITEAEKNG
jgi:alanine-glyoxylate transaminase / (R)-3-amino-2-methylpropionate-pyruvate transaminase